VRSGVDGPEAVEDGERLEPGRVVAVGERVGRLVGEAERRPRRRGAAAVTRDRAGVGLGDAVGSLGERAGPPQPERELAARPAVPALERQVVGLTGGVRGAGRIAVEPRVLGPCRGGGRQPLQLAGRARQVPRIVEGRARCRLAPAGLQPAQRDQGRAEADPRLLAEMQRGPGVGLRRRPVAAQEPEVRAHPEQVLRVAVEVALGGEAQRAVEVGGDARVVAAAHQRGGRQVDQGARRVVVVPGAGGAREGLLDQRSPSFVLVGAEQRRADVRQGVGDGLGVAELPAEPDRSLAESDRLVVALREHRQLRAPAERQRQLATLREPLEHGDRPVAHGFGLRSVTRPPQHARQPPQVVADAPGVAGRLVQLQQGPARLQRALGQPAQVGLDRHALQCLRGPRHVGALHGGEGRLPVLERLAVPARSARRPRGRGREPADGARVARAPRVVGQPGGIRSVLGLERLQHHAIQRSTVDRRDLVLDRPACELVAEAQRLAPHAEDPRVDAGVDRRGRRAHGLREQPQLGGARDHGSELDHGPCLRAQRGDPLGQRVTDAHRHAAVLRGGQRLGDEERVAARQGVQVGRITAGAPAEQRDGVRRQRRELDASHAVAGQRAEHATHLGPLAQRVGPARHHQASARTREPARQQRHEVERRVVGPVQIVDHEDRRLARPQRVERGREDLLPRRSPLHQLQQRAADGPGHVPERTHRTGRDERVAGAPQHAPRSAAGAHRGHERRLADPRLAGDDDDPTRRRRLVERGLQGRPFIVTLKQLHGARDPRRVGQPSGAQRNRGGGRPTGRAEIRTGAALRSADRPARPRGAGAWAGDGAGAGAGARGRARCAPGRRATRGGRPRRAPRSAWAARAATTGAGPAGRRGAGTPRRPRRRGRDPGGTTASARGSRAGWGTGRPARRAARRPASPSSPADA